MGSNGYEERPDAGFITSMGGQNNSDVFVKPGDAKNPRELFMRTVLVSPEEVTNIDNLYSKAKRYKVQDAIDDILDLLTLRTSINGRARVEALQAITLAVSPDALMQSLSGKSNQQSRGGIIGRFRKNGKQDNEGVEIEK